VTAARRDGRIIAFAAIAVVVLAALSTVGLAAAGGAFRSSRFAPNSRCAAPALAGSVVDVRLMNMGGPMMGGPNNGMMGGTMRIMASRQQIPTGAVSLRVSNMGSLVHELVVLPLTNGAPLGARAVDGGGRVDEASSVGEASRTCGAGTGDGIAPGGIGWVTVELPAGDYELVCNLAGHYAAGMYTDLHVS
jgi:uncharacterized cupredoxin-like copper-binding protein